MNTGNQQIGARLRVLRTERDLTQEQLAKRLKCTRNYIGMVEAGRTSLRLLTLVKFAKALRVKVSDILEDTV